MIKDPKIWKIKYIKNRNQYIFILKNGKKYRLDRKVTEKCTETNS